MRRPIAAALLTGYLLALLDLTLFQFPQPDAPANLVPLRTIAHDLHAGGRALLVNLVGNLVVFLPMGLLLPPLREGLTSARRIALFSLGLSLMIETLQYCSGRRVADVDDVLLNTLGGLLGYSVQIALRRRRGRGPGHEADPLASGSPADILRVGSKEPPMRR